MTSLWENRLFRRNAFALALFFLAVHLLYLKTVGAGFVTDFTGLQDRLEDAPFSAFLHCFGFPALHQVTNFFLYIFYTLFETAGWPWHLIHTSLHIANGFVGYLLIKRILDKSGESGDNPPQDNFIPALVTGLLFLLSPYQAEVVVWKVCFNFLFSTLLMLSSLWYLLHYLEIGHYKYLFITLGLFIVGLFTFELALALPFMAAALGIWWQKRITRQLIVRVLVPQLILLSAYFMLNKMALGSWVGHYGEAVHLNFSIREIGGNLLKYFTKYLFFWREWPHDIKESWMKTCESTVVAYGFLLDGAILLMAGSVLFKRLDPRWQVSGICWLLFFLALLPVSNLFVAYVLHGENDRYGYLASLFFFAGLVSLLGWLPKAIRLSLFALLLVTSVYLLHCVTSYWHQSTVVHNGLMKDFRWYEAPEVYVLAFPDNYMGLPMFKDFSKEDRALADALRHKTGRQPEGNLYQVAQFNMTAPDDGVTVRVDSTGQFQVTFKEWGNWWWKDGIGTWDYTTEKYEFKVVSKGSEVKFIDPHPNAAYIYSDGKNWEEVMTEQ